MTIQDIIKLHYSCTCAEIYKSRGLTDPDCVLCEHGEEIVLIVKECMSQKTTEEDEEDGAPGINYTLPYPSFNPKIM